MPVYKIVVITAFGHCHLVGNALEVLDSASEIDTPHSLYEDIELRTGLYLGQGDILFA